MARAMFAKLVRLRRLINWLSGIEERSEQFDLPIRSSYKHTKVTIGALLSRSNLDRQPRELRDVEFQVFSQFGDDGIIQYLVHRLDIKERIFVEFGVENYTEANTRFLLVNDKWAGLVMDGSEGNVAYINRDYISLFYNVVPKQAFITAENINDLIKEAGFGGKIGLLSVDIDGVDYFVWKALTVIDPAIVVAEYNATFGPERAITIPYRPDFVRADAHPSRLYWGASLTALGDLATVKGYTFVGCNANGNNAYFVRNEYADHPAIAGLERPFEPASFAEYAIDGRRVRGAEVYETIRGMPVFNVRTGQIEPL
jgi:hypothetical protein